jgi:hypothetical protein
VKRFIAILTLLTMSIGIPPVSAQTNQPTNPPPDAHTIIEKMIERNPSLSSYRARVHVDVRMLNFPYLSPKLDGTSYFKRPDSYLVAFDRVPSYARGFEKVFNDVGDPTGWERDSNVTFDGVQQLDGRPMLVLRMSKKIYSTITGDTLAFIDPTNYELIRMEWHYRSGGAIVMRQWYRSEGGFDVLSQQHAEINIPHVRAVADSMYAPYQTNVALDDAVFTKK